MTWGVFRENEWELASKRRQRISTREVTGDDDDDVMTWWERWLGGKTDAAEKCWNWGHGGTYWSRHPPESCKGKCGTHQRSHRGSCADLMSQLTRGEWDPRKITMKCLSFRGKKGEGNMLERRQRRIVVKWGRKPKGQWEAEGHLKKVEFQFAALFRLVEDVTQKRYWI